MSTYIEFHILSKLKDDFLKNIKFIFVFGYGVSEVLVVTKDDNVFGFGQNECGVLGFGHDRQVIEPTIVKELCEKQIIKFVNGLYHVMALTRDGKIYSWGRNELGVFGNGRRDYQYNRPQINDYLNNETIKDLSCGGFHSLVLTESGEVLAFGYNNFGQIGNESDELFQLTPIKLNGFNNEKVIDISCGFRHSLVLTDKGHVFGWGYNNCGQLGIEENEGKYNMYKIRDLKKNVPMMIKVENDNTEVFIEKICCGANHSMLLSRDKNIYLFGDNTFGQIGDNKCVNQMTPRKLTSSLKFKNIASHFRYNISIALSVDDIYYIWGKIGEEVITTPEETQFKTTDNIFLNSYQITHKTFQILTDFESIINSNLDVQQNQINQNIIDLFDELTLLFSSQIIAKYRNQMRVKTELDQKFLFAFGDYDIEWPYEIIGKNTLLISQDDCVYAFGSNNNGLIGFGHKNSINEPIIVKELRQKEVIDFANGVKHVIARTNTNQLYIWGYNGFGQLGNGTNDDCFVPQLVEQLRDKKIIDICCGYLHSLALTESGEVYAWGGNEFGQIGNQFDNRYEMRPIKIEALNEQKIVAISCGTYHSLALTSIGRVYSWGRNNCGQLGFINIIGSNVPKQVKIKNNQIKSTFERISCGPDHSLLLTSNGEIYGFGSNDLGQLANGCSENHFKPTKIETSVKFMNIATVKDYFTSVALSVDGDFYIWGYYENNAITKPEKTQFDSFNKIFHNFFGISHKLICN